MKKIVFLLLFFSIQHSAQAQAKDSLLLVKKYLIQLKETTVSPQSKKAKAIRLKHLVRSGSAYRGIFERNIIHTKSKNEAEEMIKSFNFIMQSAILYKGDLIDNSSQSEMIYLKNNITRLLKEIE